MYLQVVIQQHANWNTTIKVNQDCKDMNQKSKYCSRGFNIQLTQFFFDLVLMHKQPAAGERLESHHETLRVQALHMHIGQLPYCLNGVIMEASVMRRRDSYYALISCLYLMAPSCFNEDTARELLKLLETQDETESGGYIWHLTWCSVSPLVSSIAQKSKWKNWHTIAAQCS